MLSRTPDFQLIAEVNPPDLPSSDHLDLEGRWENVMITDNVFGTVRVSPYAYAARITHDVPSVHPTVVVSTRDRNLLAIESEVRGALGNGVDSFLVVVGDTHPAVDHLSHHYEVVEHLRDLQTQTSEFEVGIPTRFRKWHYRKRIDLGAQFLVAGPVIDPSTVAEQLAKLDRSEGDPPLYLMALPPFSLSWVEQGERFGSVPASDQLKQHLGEMTTDQARGFAWQQTTDLVHLAKDFGCDGVIVTGLKTATLLNEAVDWKAKATEGKPNVR